ncbi:response regulator receiver and ANTAR domain protein [Panacagrimonas perspica]|uniref:Response regulator receiver and ANTAR domain protein n=1 Tax=Panacagrimonas perspica TaxID=381431 RepID=A0A4R7PDL6_9GAMM|nr:response regulator receiver and ANTAR domain protein [Panacagrimonas perspica]
MPQTGATRNRNSKTAVRVILVDDDPNRMSLLDSALSAAGHEVVGRLFDTDDILRAVDRLAPDIVLLDVDSPTRDTLESLGQISRDRPRPIVLFAQKSDSETIRRAMRAGVSAYVVDGMNPNRLQPVIEVAIARFEEFQGMRRELENAKIKLADRRDVEKAKGLLMKRRGVNEDVAYELMRKMAMDRNIRLGEIARSLIAAAELL